ncbi:hypothetical protein [Micropruina sp.]|uniref:hypothetical protein n=1 Tax=Micropruina sp. TaxID=2737536 RepID=UPI0039E56EAA
MNDTDDVPDRGWTLRDAMREAFSIMLAMLADDLSAADRRGLRDRARRAIYKLKAMEERPEVAPTN